MPMVKRRGRLTDPWHVELHEPVPVGEDRIEVRLEETPSAARDQVDLLVNNPAFDFLRDEPDLYAD